MHIDPGRAGVTDASLRIDPPRSGTAACFVLAALLGAGLLLADPAGRLLAAPAVLVALGYGVRDVVRRPVLSADAAGIRVLAGWRHVDARWTQVEALRVVHDRRTPVLEIDLGHQVVVLSRRRLGLAPQDVLEDLQQLRR